MLELLDYELIKKEGSCLIGEASFYLTKIKYTARRIKHMKKGDMKWFNWPTFCEEDGDHKNWFAYGEFSKEDTDKIFAALRIEVNKFLEEKDRVERENLRKSMEAHESNPPPPSVDIPLPAWASHGFNPEYDSDSEVIH